MARTKHISPIYATSGSQGLLRRRFIQDTIKEQIKHGWRIDRIDGAVKGELRAALSQGGVFLTDRILVVVRNPAKADLELYVEHLSVVDPDIVLLLDYEGDPKGTTKIGKFLKNLGKYYRPFSVSKKAWEADNAATAFCIREAKGQHGKKMTEALATALVSRLGINFGFLSFEIWKMAVLADLEGSDEITNIHAKQGMADIVETNVFPAIDALAMRNAKILLKVLIQIKRTSRKDPTMGICRLIGKQAVLWAAAVDLHDRGVSVNESANRLGVNAWYFGNKVLPKIRRWSSQDLRRLLRALAESERSVLQGHIYPWQGLLARLAEVCK